MRAIDQFYLDSYGKVPLLTPEEELILGRAIQLANTPDATPRMKRAGLRAKNRMIEANMRLGVTLAMKFLPRCNTMDLHDLVQEAALGLHSAADRFDPTRGYKFSTYAYWWIRQGLSRAIWGQDRTIRLPVNAAESLFRMRRLTQEALADGRSISREEAAKGACITVENANAATLASGVYSLNYIKSGIDSEIIDLLPAPAADDFARDLGIDQEDLLGIIDQLPRDEAYAISAFFGLHGWEPKSLSKIGRDLGVSRQAVTTAKDRALRRIRRVLHVQHGLTA
jgi:RNA polymerase sigma factor (sigma-70 family)